MTFDQASRYFANQFLIWCQFLYFDALLNQRRYQQHLIFPTSASELDNRVICVPSPGNRRDFGCLASNLIASLDLAFEKVQCFPFYIYAKDGSNRHENITDWTLKHFQSQYGEGVSKWNIFHYVYAMLHHPQYCERYAENLKRDLPYIPLLTRIEAYQAAVSIGSILMNLHIYYEQQEPYPLILKEDPSVPFGQPYIVGKMKLTPDHSAVIVNKEVELGSLRKSITRNICSLFEA